MPRKAAGGGASADRPREKRAKREREDPAASGTPFMDHDTEAVDSSGLSAGEVRNDTSTAVHEPEEHDNLCDNMPRSAPSATVAKEKAPRSTPPAFSPDICNGGVAKAAADGGGGEGQAEGGVANLIFPVPTTCGPSNGDDPAQSEATTGSCSPPAAAAASFSFNPTLLAEGGGSSTSMPAETPSMFPRESSPPENVTSSSRPSSSTSNMISPQHVPAPTAVIAPIDSPATTAQKAATGDADASISYPTKVSEPPASNSVEQEHEDGAALKPPAGTLYIYQPADAPVPSPSALQQEQEDSPPGPSLVSSATADSDSGAPGRTAAAAAVKQEQQQDRSNASEKAAAIVVNPDKSTGKGSTKGTTPAAQTSSLSPSSPPYNVSKQQQQQQHSVGQRQPPALQQGSPAGGPHEWANQANNLQQQHGGYQQPLQAFYGHSPMQHGSGQPMVLGGGGGGGSGMSYQSYSGFSLPVAGRAPLFPTTPGQGGGSFDYILYQQQQHQHHHMDGSMEQARHCSTPAAATPAPTTASANPAPPAQATTIARHSPPSTNTSATGTGDGASASQSSGAAGATQNPGQGMAVTAAPQGGGGGASGGARGGAARGTVAGVMAAAAAAGGADGDAVQNAYNDIGLVVTRTKELEKIMRDLFHATGERRKRERGHTSKYSLRCSM